MPRLRRDPMLTRVDVLLDTVRAGRDPFDFFPWRWEPYLDDEGRAAEQGGICTPNPGTYWLVLADVDAKVAALVCQLVNMAAAERYGTGVPAC